MCVHREHRTGRCGQCILEGNDGGAAPTQALTRPPAMPLLWEGDDS